MSDPLGVERLPLFESPRRVTQMVRATDPSTSKAAAVRAQDDISADHRRRIVLALEFFHVRGATAKEIAAYLGPDFSSVQVTRRIVELRASGHIVTLDGLAGELNAGPNHAAYRVVREGCCVHVKAEHATAAIVLYRAESVRRKSA